MFENLIVSDKIGQKQNLISQVVEILVERVSNTDFSPEKTIETMNEYFKKQLEQYDLEKLAHTDAR